MDTNKLFKKYEGLAKIYAKKLFSYERIGFEKEDVEQELKIKIFTSLTSYQKKWEEWKETGRYKPIPLPYYLRTALINKVKDMANSITKNSFITHVDEYNVDMGREPSFSKISFKEKEIVVKDVDLLTGLDSVDKSIFCLYLKGYTPTYIQKVFRQRKVKETIEKQVGKLEVYRKELLMDDKIHVVNNCYTEN